MRPLQVSVGIAGEPQSRYAGRVKSIAGYEILEAVEQGGAVEVYRVQQGAATPMLLKIFRRQKLSADERLQLARNLEVLAGIEHARIVGLVEKGIQDGDHWYVVPEAQGPSLAKEVEHRFGTSKQPFGVDEVLQIGIALGEALGHLHERGLVHGRLSAEGILLLPTVGVVLQESMPFQAGGVLDTDENSGNPYASPEQMQGDPVTPGSDVYQVGLLLYHLLTGRLPLEDENSFQTVLRRLQEEMPPPSRHREGLSEEVDTILLKCLRAPVEKRYEDCNTFLEEVLKLDPRSGELLPGQEAVGPVKPESDPLMNLLLPADSQKKAMEPVSLTSTILPGALAGLLLVLAVLFFLR